MHLTMPEAPEYFSYDAGGLCYFEVWKDGAVTPVSCDAASRRQGGEHTCLAAYLRAREGETALYVAAAANLYGKLAVYHVGDLEAFANRLGIGLPADHVHEIEWSLSPVQPDSKAYAYVDVLFKCGCTMGRENFRTMVQQLKEQRGWNVVLSAPPREVDGKVRLKVSRCSLR